MEPLVHKDQPVRQALWEQQEIQEHKDQRVQQELPAHKDQQAQRVLRVPLEL